MFEDEITPAPQEQQKQVPQGIPQNVPPPRMPPNYQGVPPQGVVSQPQQVYQQGIPAYMQAPVQPDVPPQYVQPNTQVQPNLDAPVQPNPTAYTADNPLDVGVQIFSNTTGVTVDALYDAIAPAMSYNDPKLINLATITAGLKPDQVQQAEALATALYNQAQVERKNTIQTAHTKAGGEQQWQQAIQAFKTKAPASLLQAAKAMEQAGHINEAVDLILEVTRGYGLLPSAQGQAIQGQPVGAMGATGLTKDAFNAELATMIKEVGANNLTSHPRFNQVHSARKLGIQQGL